MRRNVTGIVGYRNNPVEAEMADFLIAAHYETENYVPPPAQYLEDHEYGRALDAIVKGDFLSKSLPLALVHLVQSICAG